MPRASRTSGLMRCSASSWLMNSSAVNVAARMSVWRLTAAKSPGQICASFANRVRSLLPQVYSCSKGLHHYRSMAKTNYRGYLKAEVVSLKKYFYVLRPLLAARWLEKYGTPAPIEFAKLLHLIDSDSCLLSDVQDLLARKRAAPELGLAPPVASINAFIEQELERHEGVAPPSEERGNVLPLLNDTFRQSLREAWA